MQTDSIELCYWKLLDYNHMCEPQTDQCSHLPNSVGYVPHNGKINFKDNIEIYKDMHFVYSFSDLD